MTDELITRKTRCPVCGRVTDAYKADLGAAWTFNPHKRRDAEATDCTADATPWRLFGAHGRAEKGDVVWDDVWRQA